MPPAAEGGLRRASFGGLLLGVEGFRVVAVLNQVVINKNVHMFDFDWRFAVGRAD